MTRWFTSDLHLGHANIIRYCQRPFVNTDHMNTVLVDNINSVATADDELWILGDIALGTVEDSLLILRRINARLILMAGNHDRFHPLHGKKSHAWLERYGELSGAERIEVGNLELDFGGVETVALSHFPYAQKEPDRFEAWRPRDTGKWLLCGHVHETWAQSGRQINVGVDAHQGWPLSESHITDLIEQGPRYVPAPPWVPISSPAQ